MKFYDVQTWVTPACSVAVHGLDRDVMGAWREHGSWYYKIYPALLESVKRVKTDVLGSELPSWPCRAFAIRFPESHAPSEAMPDGTPLALQTIVIVGVPDGADAASECHGPCDGRPVNRMAGIATWSAPESRHMSEVFSLRRDMPIKRDAWPPRSIAVARAVVMTLMIAADPQYVREEILTRDEAKWDGASVDERRIMVERAVRRGKCGASLGRDFEATPHWRRPHLAIRHTGKGGEIPRLVSVRGSVVHLERLARVPNGRYADDGTEVE